MTKSKTVRKEESNSRNDENEDREERIGIDGICGTRSIGFWRENGPKGEGSFEEGGDMPIVCEEGSRFSSKK